MTARRGALSFTAACVLLAGGAAIWASVPTKVRADPPAAMAKTVLPSIWSKAPIDRDYMVRGVLDYRDDSAKR